MTLKIRKANKKDIEGIYALGLSIKEFEISKKVRFYIKKELKEWIAKPKDNILIVAVDNKEVKGFLFAKMISSAWCMLDNIGVDTRYRHHNIGGMLFGSLMDILKKNKTEYLQAVIETKNKHMRGLAKELGFKEEKSYLWVDKILKKIKY